MTGLNDNIEIIRALYAAYQRRDATAIFAAHAPDVTIYQSPLLPWGGHYQGISGAQQFFARLTAHIDSRIEIERLFAADDAVVAVGRTCGTVRATGKPFDVAIAHLWTLDFGKIAHVRFYIDTPALLAALHAK